MKEPAITSPSTEPAKEARRGSCDPGPRYGSDVALYLAVRRRDEADCQELRFGRRQTWKVATRRHACLRPLEPVGDHQDVTCRLLFRRVQPELDDAVAIAVGHGVVAPPVTRQLSQSARVASICTGRIAREQPAPTASAAATAQRETDPAHDRLTSGRSCQQHSCREAAGKPRAEPPRHTPCAWERRVGVINSPNDRGIRVRRLRRSRRWIRGPTGLASRRPRAVC